MFIADSILLLLNFAGNKLMMISLLKSSSSENKHLSSTCALICWLSYQPVYVCIDESTWLRMNFNLSEYFSCTDRSCTLFLCRTPWVSKPWRKRANCTSLRPQGTTYSSPRTGSSPTSFPFWNEIFIPQARLITEACFLMSHLALLFNDDFVWKSWVMMNNHEF